MKVIIMMLLFLLSPIALFSQEKVVVDYGIIYHVSEYPKKVSDKYKEHKDRILEYFKMLEKRSKRADEVSFQLKIEGQKSYFTHPLVDRQDESLYFLLNYADGDHIFYTDIVERRILEEFNYWQVDILAKITIDEYPWKLVDEQKTIYNYECSKAVKDIPLMDFKGKEYVLHVEAWYTEEIPLQFGPKDYCNLPGLILELKEDKFTYYVKKINYKADFEDFKEPTKGIEMSLREFSENKKEIRAKGKQTFLNSRG